MPWTVNPDHGYLEFKGAAGGGGGAIDTNAGDDAVAVSPSGVGNFNWFGLTVANATHAKPLYFKDSATANALDLDLQVSTEITGAPADMLDAGICSFDDTAFAVDANGYVTLVGGGGGGGVDTNAGDDGVAVSPTGGGAFSWIGLAVANATHAKPIYFKDSATANAIDLDVQVSTEITGAPADMFDAGICSFDDTQFAVDANGYVILAGGSTLPAVQTLTGDDAVATGPDGSGNIDIQGLSVANATNAKPLYFNGGANAEVAEIQVSTEITGAPADMFDAGIASFDDTMFAVDANGYVTLVPSATFTTGSVIFWGTAAFEEDNANFFWDDTNNRLGIGTATPLHTLDVTGHVRITATSVEDDAHGLEIIADAAGFADFKAIDIDYITGALAAGEEDAVILINIDETLAVGGEIFALEVLTTTIGSDVVGGLKVGIGVDAVHQKSGTFGDIDSVLNIAVDVTAAVASGGAGNITMFVADNDTVTMGDAAVWDETEVIIDTGASGSGIAPVFAFSTGGAGFTNFVPVDGTNGFQNTGIIDWDSGDLSAWATNASGLFEIRITRTRNSLTTKPIVDTLQLGAVTGFAWDKSGDVNLNSLTLVVPLVVTSGGTGVATLTDGGIILGSGTGAVTVTAQPTNGQLLIGSTGVDPVLGSIASADGSVTITGGAGTIDLAVAAGDDAILTLTGDVGGALSPTAGNINILGSTVANATNAKPLYINGSVSTLTAQIQVATEITGAPGDKLDAGLCSFDDTAFAVDANGYVTLAGGAGPAVDTNTGDDAVAISPSATGNFGWIGLAVANATHAKPIYFKDSATANSIDLDVQVATEITGAPADMLDAGICSFDDTAFAVDANGYVTFVGGAAGTITGDSGGALSQTASNWNILGLSGCKTSGATSTLTVKSPPYADASASATSALNSGEFVTGAYTRTLPASAGLADGDLFEYVCTSASALVIQSVSAQKIRVGTLITAAAGTVTSTSIGDSISLRFRATDGFFYATSVVGTWIVV